MFELRPWRSRPAAITAVLVIASLLLWLDRSLSGPGVAVPPRDVGTGSQTDRLADTRDFVHVTDVRQSAANDDELVVTLRIDPGFHINANPASFAELIATRLAFVGVEPTKIVYPDPVRFKPRFVDEWIDVYQGTIEIEAIFPDGTLAQTSTPEGAVTAQACTDEVCLPPAELPLPKE